MKQAFVIIAIWMFCTVVEIESAFAAQPGAAKPPVGAQLNPQHPLANGLVICPLLNEGSGQSIWEPITGQNLVVPDSPLVWDTLPNTAQYPWAGPALKFNQVTGPTTKLNVSQVPLFQVMPGGNTGYTYAYLWSPGIAGPKAVRRVGDTNTTAGFTMYEGINPSQWTIAPRDAAGGVQTINFPYTVGAWIFTVVCLKEGECKIYQDGVLVSTTTNVSVAQYWGGEYGLPSWWFLTEGPAFHGPNYPGFDGDIAGAWLWSRYLSQADVTSLYNAPWGMFTNANAAPGIITQPADTSVVAGQTATFNVVAAGTGPLSYQWSKNGAAIPGATNAAYTTPATVIGDNGALFSVTVTNVAANVTSPAAKLTVNAVAIPPAITTQPYSLTAYTLLTARFSVIATGSAPLTYQWTKNGVAIPGATGAEYTTPTIVIGDNGAKFAVTVTNAAGSVTSANATLTVQPNQIPTITTQPANQTVVAGQKATFTVVAGGVPPFTYQWKKNGVAIPGATSATYTTPATVIGDNGAQYSVTVTNGTGAGYSVTSVNAVLTVSAAALPPSITTQPSNQTVTAGQAATFTVVAAGTAPLSYQWSKNGQNVGTNSASYTLTTAAADNGAQVNVTVSGTGPPATSNTATLTVVAAPSITTASPLPAGTVGAAYSQTFAVTGGAPPFTWTVSAGALPGGLGLSAAGVLSGTPTTSGPFNFTVRVTDSLAAAATMAFALTVNANQPPAITSPASCTPNPTNVGQTAAFAVSASDPDGDTLTYAWSFGDGGTANSSTANHVYALAGVFSATVTVKDPSGLAVTSNISVTVNNTSTGTGTGTGSGTGTGTGTGSGTGSGTGIGAGVGTGTSTATGTGAGTGGGAGTAPMPLAMTVSKVKGSTVFSAGGHDSVALSGVLPGIPRGFSAAGQVLTVNYAGATAAFTLDKNGHAHSATGAVMLKLKPVTRIKPSKIPQFVGGNASFAIKLQKGAWASVWGFDPTATVANNVTMTATLQLGANVYSATVSVAYKSKARVGAKFFKP